jgi:anti-sigma B factor antagonist
MSMKSLYLDEFAATRYEVKDGTQIVSVAGEVDLSSAPRLAEVIWKARRQAGSYPPRVVVDLSGVEFMDTAGLEVLLEAWNASRQSDERMCLVAPEGPITRLLEVTGLSDLLDLYAELETAVKSFANSSSNQEISLGMMSIFSPSASKSLH